MREAPHSLPTGPQGPTREGGLARRSQPSGRLWHLRGGQPRAGQALGLVLATGPLLLAVTPVRLGQKQKRGKPLMCQLLPSRQTTTKGVGQSRLNSTGAKPSATDGRGGPCPWADPP